MYKVAVTLTYIYIYTYTLRLIAQSGAEEFWIFSESVIFLPISSLFLCAVSVSAPLTRHKQMGASRVQQWPELKLVTLPSCPATIHLTIHPSNPPSAISFLHWWALPSLFRRERVVIIIQHNENSAATQNSSFCAPRGMTTTARDGDGGTGGSPSWDEKRGETCLQQMG